MKDFVNFAAKWADAISEVFGKYPLAGAVVTLGALVLGAWLHKEMEIDTWTKRALLFLGVLVVWLICVPLLGLLIDAVVALGGFTRFIYDRYNDQPFFVLIVTGICIPAGLAWVYLPWFRDRRPKRWVRAGIVAVIWITLILLGVPIMNQLYPPPRHEEGHSSHPPATPEMRRLRAWTIEAEPGVAPDRRPLRRSRGVQVS